MEIEKKNIEMLNYNFKCWYTSYKFKKLFSKKNYMIKELYFLNNKLRNIKKNIEENKKEIGYLCENSNLGHQWIREKEDCIYGETYHYCKICGKSKYSDLFFDVNLI